MQKKMIVRGLIFGIILIILFNVVSGILKKPKDPQWDASGLEYVYDYPGLYDVIFCGTSIAVMNVSNEELYSEYGITAVTLGEPEQFAYLSYYTLLEALRYQSPKVVFFDINSLFYPESIMHSKINSNEYYYLHLSLDGLKNLSIKYEALQVTKELKEDLDVFSYFFSIYNDHSNWEMLNKTNFIRESGKLVMNGNLMSFTIADDLVELRESIDTNYDESVQGEELIEFNKAYLIKMLELCKENDIQLVLLHGGGVKSFLTPAKYNVIKQIAAENDIPFIDMSQCENEMDFDWHFDSTDGNHHNIMGAKKWTDYLGNYLINNYQFDDKREVLGCTYFQDEVERYYNALEAMQTKIDLLSAINFDQYLDVLGEIDTDKNTIFIAVNDEATEKLLEDKYNKLMKLGVQCKLLNKLRYSYVAVLDNHIVKELLGDYALILDGSLDNGSKYQISSGGYSSEILASIQIDGTEWIQGGRGFNIVVYNKEFNEVLSSVYFDTFLDENPSTARKSNIIQEQYEVGVNDWGILNSY